MKTVNTRQKRGRETRGEITTEIERQFERSSERELLSFLTAPEAQSRTAAAALLGRRHCLAAIPALCEQLSKETALYSRIAISEALSALGEPALPGLLALVGKVGRNQHQTLPKELFKKWNYPLPRDIVIRTIVKIGKTALPSLVEKLDETSDPAVAAELIDAIGYISYYSGDRQAFEALRATHDRCREQPLVIWKLLRAFQAFPHNESVELLQETLLTGELPQHRWEAARSLGQIGTLEAEKILQSAQNEQHALVKEMLRRSLEHINEK